MRALRNGKRVLRGFSVAGALTAALLLCSRGTRADEPTEVRGLAERVSPSVVQVVEVLPSGTGTQGTGFFVRPRGVIVTNHHVIEHMESTVVVVLRDGRKVAVEGLLADDPGHDLAILKVRPSDGADYPVLPIAPLDSIHAGERVMLVGNPYGFGGSVFWGNLSALRDDFPDDWKRTNADAGVHTRGPLVQHSIAAGPGSSGSPLVDELGRVVGVNHSGIGGSEVNFGAHASALVDLLARTRLDAKPRPLGADVRRNLITSAIFFAVGGLAVLVSWSVGRRRRGRQTRFARPS